MEQLSANSQLVEFETRLSTSILKEEIAVFSTTLSEKDHFNLHTDLAKMKVMNIDNFYENYYKLH